MRQARYGLAAVFVACVAGSAPALAATHPEAHRDSGQTITMQPLLNAAIVGELNRVRRAYGLPMLKVNAALSSAARQHSDEMAHSGVFQHQSPGGAPFWKRVQRYYGSANYHRWSVGEAMLWSSPDVSAAAAVSDWLASPPHRKILLDPNWLEVGVSAIHDTSAPGAFEDLECTIVTADFGARTGEG